MLPTFLILRDTAGQERFHTITKAYYRGAHVSWVYGWGEGGEGYVGGASCGWQGRVRVGRGT